MRRSLLALSLLTVILAPAAAAQARPAPAAMRSAPITNVGYELTFTPGTAANRTVSVAMTFSVAGTQPVFLAMPAWTPGAYEISEFAKNVSKFAPVAGSAAVRWDKADPRTWRLFPARAGAIRITYDVTADSLDNAMAWAKPDFLLVNGTNVFLYPYGQPLEFAASVKVTTDPAWLVATGMTATGPHQYRAGTYHDLVDMPFFIGKFDLDSIQSGKTWVRLATYPSGNVAGDVRSETRDKLKAMFPVMDKVFGETPFTQYTVMQIADSSYAGASGLEHQNSHVDVVTPLAVGNPFLDGLYSHEIFHAWNVKRLRPADLFPYRYDQPQPTVWLWVSEGITDYYADLILLRAGLSDSAQFLGTTVGKVAEVVAAPPVALEDASLSTWVHPTDGTGYLYYPKGSLAGFLLDILIRDGSDNRQSLDDVMRGLYETAWKRGRGFTADEWWGAVSKAAGGKSFDDFYAKYIDGREPFPWTQVLPLAGLAFVTDTVHEPRLGVGTRPAPDGRVRVVDVAPNSTAAAAGLETGDILLKVADIDVADQSFGTRYRTNWASKNGATFPIQIERNGMAMTLQGTVQPLTRVTNRIDVDPAANAKATRIRSGLFHGTTTR